MSTSRNTATTRCRPGSNGFGSSSRGPRRGLQMLDEFSRAMIRKGGGYPRPVRAQFLFRMRGRRPAWWPGRSPATSTRLGARLRAMMGSDISHWDVPDMTEPVAEAYELVERGTHHGRGFPRVQLSQPGAAARRHESTIFPGHDLRDARWPRRWPRVSIDCRRADLAAVTKKTRAGGTQWPRRMRNPCARCCSAPDTEEAGNQRRVHFRRRLHRHRPGGAEDAFSAARAGAGAPDRQDLPRIGCRPTPTVP